ncbi:DUF308 domain-containing protein [Eubacteriaceae bacterium ES3]|nr:DUF308 domain-containing protein [Eubacteriaceae bacterium ES3]
MRTEKVKTYGTDILERAYGRWWLMLLDGLCLMIICGITLFERQFALLFMVKLFGVYRGFMGIMYLITYFVYKSKYQTTMGASLGRGIFDLVVAAIFLLFTSTMIKFFIVIIGIAALFSGVLLLGSSRNNTGSGAIVKIVIGVMLLAFGIFSLFNPSGQMDFYGLLLGIVLGISGFFLALQSFSMRKNYKEIKKAKKGYDDYHIE